MGRRVDAVATCSFCNQEMLTAKGCTVSRITLDGAEVERIPHGSGHHSSSAPPVVWEHPAELRHAVVEALGLCVKGFYP
jgi:hypothetical protein